MLLAGLGAEVIKLEDPRGGDLARENSPYVGRDGVTTVRAHEDDISISHLTRARGKRGISLNLKHPEAASIFADLVAISDIVVENFTAGTADRLGVGYAAARERNPAIIYCSLSGFGATGAEGSKAMDVLIQALSGAMFTSGSPEDPPVRIGIPMADMLAPLFGVIGILAALEQRHRTGLGQQVDVSMLGALTSFVAIENWRAMGLAGMPARTGLTVQRLSPFGVFGCADGWIALVAVHQQLAKGLFAAMRRPELIDDPRFCSRDQRVAHAPELEALIGDWCRPLPTAEVVAALDRQGVPAAPVRDPADALSDPRVVARGETMAVEHPSYPVTEELRTAGIPMLFSDADTGFAPHFAVRIGEHNEAVYGELLGYPAGRLAELADAGII
jgi:crotonobetainyl-CoA:carnitine CoA-transferase CaiB-like acyl-CoA transferase